MKKPLTLFLLVTISAHLFGQNTQKLPNILWITSEDNGPFLGCYGDKQATTPYLDKLASQGFRYTRAYANAPVCAPTRNTIITGIYACSGGNQHMRSEYNKSDQVHYYPQYLREKGYYCTNNEKTDYNINKAQTKGIWDDVSAKAHYKNRNPGQPFFAIFNSLLTHESSIYLPKSADKLRHDPAKMKLPPYHPDTPEIRHDWAYYYDNIEDMDTWVGKLLRELEESGEAENTIVVYYSDHGGILTRSKRWLYESGTHVPFLIRIPEKFKHLWPAEKPGIVVDRLVSFVDLAPTLLSIIGTPKSDYMQGQAFLGAQKSAEPPYVYLFRDRQDERYDMSRGIRDKTYRYIHNYMPYRPHGQYLETLWYMPTTRSWEEACKAGKCNDVQQAFWKPKPAEELYDTENDPWEVNNLADKPQYKAILERMRKACHDWQVRINDTGVIPEADLISRTQNTSAYDYMRSGQVDEKALIDAADLASMATKKDIPKLLNLLTASDPAIRYWAASGLLQLGPDAKSTIPALQKAALDTAPNVAIIAAEALYKLGEKDVARKTLIQALDSTEPIVRNYALNTLEIVNEDSPQTREAVVAMVKKAPQLDRTNYDQRVAKTLMAKWHLDSQKLGINWPWQ